MEAQGSLKSNQDHSQDLKMGLTNGKVSANAFVSGYKAGDPNGFPKPTGDSFRAIGANMGVQTGAAGASVQAAHIPNFGNQVTTSANINLLNHNDHKVNASAFRTTNMPNVGPNFVTQGAEVNYKYKETLGVGASTVHIPAAKMHQHSVSTEFNLHNTPTSSLDMSLGANRTTTPFGRGNWQRGGMITFRKEF